MKPCRHNLKVLRFLRIMTCNLVYVVTERGQTDLIITPMSQCFYFSKNKINIRKGDNKSIESYMERFRDDLHTLDLEVEN